MSRAKRNRTPASDGQLDLLEPPSGQSAIVLASGFVLDLARPSAAGMPIEDIAQALSSQPRWGGACRPWYSVAEHSVMASHLVPPAFAYDALMHDCEEFLGDWPSPVKALLGGERVKEALRPLKEALARRFGFRLDVPEVKVADLACMATELRDLLPPHWMNWGHLPPPLPARIVPVGPERAYAQFMDRYAQLRPAGSVRPR